MKIVKENLKTRKSHHKRYTQTLSFLDGLITPTTKILDLGPPNPFSSILLEKGFDVKNTKVGQDLDISFEQVQENFDIVLALEIIEHLVSPFPLLRAIKADKLVVSVPLKLWFKSAYWSKRDPYDRHYHEFEPQQLDMLLNKAGWGIVKKDKWKSYDNKIGVRPLLRRFTPRYYIVYCERM